METKYYLFEKNNDLIDIKSKNKKRSSESLNLTDIKDWYFMKEKKELKLNRWWSFIFVICVLVLPLIMYTFLKNETTLDQNEFYWPIISYALQIISVLGFVLFTIWILCDLLMGWRLNELLFRRLLIRKQTLLFFRLKKGKDIEIKLKNKKEGMRIIKFTEVTAYNK